jgi:hypothetical protein
VGGGKLVQRWAPTASTSNRDRRMIIVRILPPHAAGPERAQCSENNALQSINS